MRKYLLFLLLLSACLPTTYQPENFYVGSEGITVSFWETSPTEVYEGTEDVENIETFWLTVDNRGAANVSMKEIVLTLRSDPFYMVVEDAPDQLSTPDQREFGFDSLFDIAGDIDLGADELVLEGKGFGYPEGDFLDVFYNVRVKPILGARQHPTTQLFASVCYPYITYFGDSVCVDANSFNGNQQSQICQAQTLTYADQGAPVAVTMVENKPSPRRVTLPDGGYTNVVHPKFIVHIENVGSGTVLMPTPDTQREQLQACNQDIPDDLLNAVELEAALSDIELECSPEIIRLIGGQGVTQCTLPLDQEIPIATPNYLGQLRINLTYMYRNSASHEVEIIRLPQGAPSDELPEFVKDDNPAFIAGVDRCSYCSSNPGDSECRQWPDEAVNERFSCSCTKSQCLRIAVDKETGVRRCVVGKTWCAGSTYCCAPE